MKRVSITRLAAILLTMAMACKPGGDKESPQDSEVSETNLISVNAEQFRRNGMKMAKVQQGFFPEILQVSGTVDVPPENRAVVSAIQGGFVREIPWMVGDRVAQGDRIAMLESPAYIELQQAYLETQAKLPALKAAYERQQTLLDENISSEKVFLEAQSAYQVAQARNTSLSGQLRLLHIPLPTSATEALRSRSPVLAPLSGNITRVSVRKGAFVSQAAEIVEIVNKDHLHLELKVYEKDIGKLQVGQAIRFRVPEQSDKVYEAVVHLIGSAVDTDRSVQVHAHLAEGVGEEFLVGMFVQAEVLLEKESDSDMAWAVPESSVIQEGNQSYILVLASEGPQGYQFRKAAVRPGRKAGNLRELKGIQGLDTNSRVLSSGAFSLIGN